MIVRLRVKSLNYERLLAVHRDNGRGLPCLYCWEPMDAPTWDHVIPIAKGGPNCRENLVVVCSQCNFEKADLALPEYEGLLLGFGRPSARCVSQFTRWVIRDWPEPEQQIFARRVSAGWSEGKRAAMAPSAVQRLDVRKAMSRMLRASVVRGRVSNLARLRYEAR